MSRRKQLLTNAVLTKCRLITYSMNMLDKKT